MTKNIVVFGATGQQGSAFITALGKENKDVANPIYTIYALSRNPSSRSSARLSAVPGVKVVGVAKNCMDEPFKAFEATGLAKGDVYGVFSVQGYVGDKVEIKQGEAIVAAAVEYGTKHFIYASVDLGGLEDTGFSGAEVKRHVENVIKASGMGYTMLRATQFLDNLLPSSHLMFKVSRTILLRHTFQKHPERKHQMVSTRDIGRAGARAIVEPEKYLNSVIRLAGDEFTMPELEARYKEVMGEPIQETYSFLAGFAKWMVPELAGMARYFDDHGFGVDLAETKSVLPDVEDLRAFLERYKESRA